MLTAAYHPAFYRFGECYLDIADELQVPISYQTYERDWKSKYLGPLPPVPCSPPGFIQRDTPFSPPFAHQEQDYPALYSQFAGSGSPFIPTFIAGMVPPGLNSGHQHRTIRYRPRAFIRRPSRSVHKREQFPTKHLVESPNLQQEANHKAPRLDTSERGDQQNSFRDEWPFPRRPRESWMRSAARDMTPRVSVHDFFSSSGASQEDVEVDSDVTECSHKNTGESGKEQECPPPYNSALLNLERERRPYTNSNPPSHEDENPDEIKEDSTPSRSDPTHGSQDLLEAEWNSLRKAQSLLKKDQDSLIEAKAAHKAKVEEETIRLQRGWEELKIEIYRFRQERESDGMLPSDREYSREYPFRNLDDFQDEDLGPPPPFMDFDHLEPDFGMEYDGCGMRGGEFDMRGSGFDMRDDDFNFREDMRNFPRHPRRPRRGLNAFSSDRTWQPDTTSPIKEAKTAFQNYDKQWKNIFDNTNAQKYPYPTTTREAGPLRSPSRILVSRSRGHQAFMAEDDIMKANTMLFFLDAFNMRPYIAGGLNLRIDRHESHAKVDELKQQLQTERLRWHPDKLKWRKEGRELEDVDRAVFEGIQELWKQCNDLGRMRK